MDLELIETSNGGDLVKNPKDLSVIDGFDSMVYMALFGGNIEQSTPIVRLTHEQDHSWWGNKLFFENDPGLQFNSETERTLSNVALTSFGLTLIQKAVKKDLEFMRPLASVTVAITLIAPDKVAIGVKLIRPQNLGQQVLVYLWDETTRRLIETEPIDNGGNTVIRVFDDTFDLTFE